MSFVGGPGVTAGSAPDPLTVFGGLGLHRCHRLGPAARTPKRRRLTRWTAASDTVGTARKVTTSGISNSADSTMTDQPEPSNRPA